MDQALPRIEQAEAALSECIARAAGWDAACGQAAANLAQALAESPMRPGDMVGRLCALGVSSPEARRLLANARRVVRDREQGEEDQQLGGAAPICPHCFQPISPMHHFCPTCCGPVSAIASMDPLGQVFSTGRAYQRAVSGKPRLVVVVAMWLIFGPGIAVALGSLAMHAMAPRGQGLDSYGPVLEVLALAVLAATIALQAAILWKVTTRWVRSRR